MEITIPSINQLPGNCAEAADFIWSHQDKLNAISNTHGKGTIELGRHLTPEAKKDLLLDFQLAICSEVNELQENFFWKHWSKEAKTEGKRWQLIHPELEVGEGTLQNVQLEITDLIFFGVSYLQSTGESSAVWSAIWGNPAIWEGLKQNDVSLSEGQDPLKGDQFTAVKAKKLCEAALKFNALPHEAKFSPKLFIGTLVDICLLANMNWGRALHLYAQKLIKNYERQIRGRKQVGDEHAATENASVR